MRFIQPPFCPVMGSPFEVDMGDGVLSLEALSNRPPFERLRAVLLYDDLARRLVSSMKYADRNELARWIANWMRSAGRELISSADVIVPVPLHRHRLLHRRFNQSAELARHIASGEALDLVTDALLRSRSTRQQVGLSEREREANVAGAFSVPRAKRIEISGRRVLLIDDVYTSGATAKAATRALMRAGAKAVDVLVFAKVETTGP